MRYNLFIDDQIDDINEDTGFAIRDPKRIDPTRQYVGVKTIQEALDYISEHGCPVFISFDHDLGLYPDGKPMETSELAKWLVEQDLNHPGFIPEEFNYQVHSANVYGKSNLSILSNYLKTR
jgi:hypothetical protein